MATKNETRIHRNYKRTGYEKHNILFSRQQINQKNYVEETKRKEKGKRKKEKEKNARMRQNGYSRTKERCPEKKIDKKQNKQKQTEKKADRHE